MRSVDALRDGIGRVNRAPVVLACVFVVTLLTALPFSMVMRDALQAHLGNSMVAEQVARGVNVQWWTEFTAQAGALGKTFQHDHHRIRRRARQPQRACRRRGRARRRFCGSAPATSCCGCSCRAAFSIGTRARGRRGRTSSSRPAASISSASSGWRRSSRSPTTCSSPSCTRCFSTISYRRADARRHRRADGASSCGWRSMRSSARCSWLVNIVFDYAKVRAVVEDRRSMIGAIARGRPVRAPERRRPSQPCIS